MRATFIVGTRPEAIKLAPVIRALRRAPGIHIDIVATGQHPLLAAAGLGCFRLKPTAVLDLPVGLTPVDMLSALLDRLSGFVAASATNLVVVQGDTTSALAGALSAAYHHIPVAHVEAGLRTHRIDEPFPEELNRQLITQVARLHFAPTQGNRTNLELEGVRSDTISVTGNPGIDALTVVLRRWRRIGGLRTPACMGPSTAPYVVLTLHRRESIGARMGVIVEAVADSLRRWPGTRLIVPVHPNPAVRGLVAKHLRGREVAQLIEPLPYAEFIKLLAGARLVVTDSGGTHEELTFLDRPAIIARNVTERPEGLLPGRRILGGTSHSSICASVGELIDGGVAHETAAGRLAGVRQRGLPRYVFGDGSAAQRIRDAVLAFFGVDVQPRGEVGG